MKRQLPWLILAISVLFNVFFLAGYLQARAGVEDPAVQPVTESVERQLHLDPEQAAIFSHLRDGLQEDNRLFAERLALVQQDFLNELLEPEPNPQRIGELIEADGEVRRQMQRAAHERFRAFIGMLDPEQRQRLSRHLERKRRGHHRDRWQMMRKFDTNGDGRLDEAERAAAQQHMERRQRERAERRERMMEQFDVNRDGELDAEERAAMRRAFEAEKDRRFNDLNDGA